MWRRTYLLLLVIRAYFALSPSYIHPDEVFQGPEIIAGSLFPYPSHRTWEWTTDQPIRSVVPLWLFYGLPMSLLKSVWNTDNCPVEPATIYYGLRLVMFILSFVLEDWAIYELVPSPRRRYQAIILVASSYVTWTYQTHTFSNSIETLLVLWSIVLIKRIDRIVRGEHRTSYGSCFVLGFLLVLGFFNRITFPAFVLIPGIRLLPHLDTRPVVIFVLMLSIAFWAVMAVTVDTAYYAGEPVSTSFRALYARLRDNPIITPLNNFHYNRQSSNLAEHGLHPHYQHLLINIPLLLGPALILLINAIGSTASEVEFMALNPCLTSAISGIAILSSVPHQEPRFLIPCVPLLLTCVELPRFKLLRALFCIGWMIFNAVLGIVMGVFHQGGVIPAQLAMPSLVTESLEEMKLTTPNAQVFWWKTYPPPTYLLGTSGPGPLLSTDLKITTTPLMGISESALFEKLSDHVISCSPTLFERTTRFVTGHSSVFVVAPLSAWDLEEVDDLHWRSKAEPMPVMFSPKDPSFVFERIATFWTHVNFDDLDTSSGKLDIIFARTLERMGLGVWRVRRPCDPQLRGR